MVGLLGQVREGLPDTQAMLKVPSQGEERRERGKGGRLGSSPPLVTLCHCGWLQGGGG